MFYPPNAVPTWHAASPHHPAERTAAEVVQRQLVGGRTFRTHATIEQFSGIEIGPIGIRRSGLMLDLGAAKFDLTGFLTEQGEVMAVALEYRTARFSAARMRWLLDAYRSLLAGLAEAPERVVSRVAWLEERGMTPFVVYRLLLGAVILIASPWL